MEDEALGWQSDGLGVLVLVLVPALAISIHGRRVSGGWTRSWISLAPAAWFALLFLVAPLGYLLLVVNLFTHSQVPGAITGGVGSGGRDGRPHVNAVRRWADRGKGTP